MRDEELQFWGLFPGGRFADRYEVVRKLGAGGMGMVFEVLDHSLHRERLALKIFSPDETQDDTSLLSRFRNEVLITRKLTHPNIVRTYDFAELDGGLVYMTMEFVDGCALDQFQREKAERRLDVEQAAHILREVAEGIRYAHLHGVIHRDLKPANVLLSSDGKIKVTDFGLAQSMGARERLTMTGECVGTPAYMSPEQVLGQVADQRSDIYALGMLAYELVVGKLPFRKKGWFELANQIVNEPIQSFSNADNKVPVWYEKLVLKATSKDPATRFSSTELLIDSLISASMPPGSKASNAKILSERSIAAAYPSVPMQMPNRSLLKSQELQQTTNNSIQLSLTLPTKPPVWTAVLGIMFVLSTIGLRNYLQKPTTPEILNPKFLAALTPHPARPASSDQAFRQNKPKVEIPQAEEEEEPSNLQPAEELSNESSGNFEMPANIDAVAKQMLAEQLGESKRDDAQNAAPLWAQRQRLREQLLKRRMRQEQFQSPDTPKGYRSVR